VRREANLPQVIGVGLVLVLAIETTGLSGSVALAEDAELLMERPLTEGQRSAQSLIPTIHQLLSDASRRVADIGLIGVAIGPGSFTGLRVGVTAAKTLAYALGAKTVGVDTLDVLAAQTPTGLPGAKVHTILDAQRQELFAATFAWENAAWARTSPTTIMPLEPWLQSLKPGDVVSGPNLARMSAKLPPGVDLAPQHLREPKAATIARLAFNRSEQGLLDDFWKLTPAYFRPSAAEEKAKK